jgi:hypothetical protein
MQNLPDSFVARTVQTYLPIDDPKRQFIIRTKVDSAMRILSVSTQAKYQ